MCLLDLLLPEDALPVLSLLPRTLALFFASKKSKSNRPSIETRKKASSSRRPPILSSEPLSISPCVFRAIQTRTISRGEETKET